MSLNSNTINQKRRRHVTNDLVKQKYETQGKIFVYQSWLKKDIYFINDLLRNDGRFMSFAEFRNQYQLEVNCFDIYSVIEAVPLHWKRLCRNSNKIVNVIHPHVSLLNNSLKTTKPFYQLLLKKVATINTKAYSKWHVDLNLEDTENWSQHLSKLYSISDDSELLNFYFKLFHRIIYTNSKLFKCRIIETELCTFCNEQRETLLHLFYDCSHVKTFCYSYKNYQGPNVTLILPWHKINGVH